MSGLRLPRDLPRMPTPGEPAGPHPSPWALLLPGAPVIGLEAHMLLRHYLDEGLSHAAIARRLGISDHSISTNAALCDTAFACI